MPAVPLLAQLVPRAATAPYAPVCPMHCTSNRCCATPRAGVPPPPNGLQTVCAEAQRGGAAPAARPRGPGARAGDAGPARWGGGVVGGGRPPPRPQQRLPAAPPLSLSWHLLRHAGGPLREIIDKSGHPHQLEPLLLMLALPGNAEARQRFAQVGVGGRRRGTHHCLANRACPAAAAAAAAAARGVQLPMPAWAGTR